MVRDGEGLKTTRRSYPTFFWTLFWSQSVDRVRKLGRQSSYFSGDRGYDVNF